MAGEPEAIAVRDGYAYVTVGEAVTVVPELPDFDALALVRLNRPAAPAVVDYFFAQGNYTCLALGTDRIFLGKSDTITSYEYIMAPLQCPDVSDVPDPVEFGLALSPPYPNPFNPRVNLRFELPAGVAGQLRVHDLRGNFVAEIWRGEGGPGGMNAFWSGTDQLGRACPSGTYGFVLSDLGGRQTARATGTLLR